MVISLFFPGNRESSTLSGSGGGGGMPFSVMSSGRTSFNATVAFTALAGFAVVAVIFYRSNRGHIKSPWSRRKRPLSPQEWIDIFEPNGRHHDGGAKLLKKVRSGGIDPSIRAEVWPFLLGVYDLNSSKEERDIVRSHNRRKYEKLRKQCRLILAQKNGGHEFDKIGGIAKQQQKGLQDPGSPSSDVVDDVESVSSKELSQHAKLADDILDTSAAGDDNLKVTNSDTSVLNSDASDSDSSEGPEVIQTCPITDGKEANRHNVSAQSVSSPSRTKDQSNYQRNEDFFTWLRIIRLDAVRANGEWMAFSPSQAAVSVTEAHRLAEAVGLKDYRELEPCRIFHASRLVAILEAYAVYDPEIGYCQGMSDLLSPIVTMISEDYEAFWCFVGFMKKARQNFRLDEVGIRRQLKIVSKIIQCKDCRLYSHLEKLQAEDCFFVYRMVVVLFRRELTFEQTMSLWEVMWADQAAIRVGIGKSAWGRVRLGAPPTEDLLLYAIAASVLQKRKLIIQKYSSMEEIIRECNSMAGQLDVWKLLDDAHDLVVNFHDKIESSYE